MRKKHFFYISILNLFFLSCASKKDIYYLQDATFKESNEIEYSSPIIQPNDILKISVNTPNPEAAIAYNRSEIQGFRPQNLQLIQLDGYLVGADNTINFPTLGILNTKNKTTSDLSQFISSRLINDGHLLVVDVNVRLLNAKVTILGEVRKPGTYTFTEQNITIMQALGYAGDLTINGKRDDILITREINGKRYISRINLTSTDFMDSPYYYVKPNDLIVVNPNNPRVKNAGYVGNVGTVLTIVSLALSITILLTR